MIGVEVGLVASDAIVPVRGRKQRFVSRHDMAAGTGRHRVRTDEIEPVGCRDVIELGAEPCVVGVAGGAVGSETGTVLGVEVSLVASDAIVPVCGRKQRFVSRHDMAAGTGSRCMRAHQFKPAGYHHVINDRPGPPVLRVARGAVGRERAAMILLVVALVARDTVVDVVGSKQWVVPRDGMATLAWSDSV